MKVVRGSGFLEGITAISAGYFHSCARSGDGTAWCWGQNDRGELADGSTDPRLSAVEVVQGTGYLTDVKSVDAGIGDTCAVKGDRTAWCWGRDNAGQLGDGSTDLDPHPYPSRVIFP